MGEFNKYQVEEDSSIREAGFSNVTNEEKALIENLNKYSQCSTIACIILSLLHCHYFYVGRVGRGLVCLCTANFLYIGFLIDLFLIACGKFKDKEGKLVCTPARMKAELDLRNFYQRQARG